jgi:hypothetical protein
LARVKEKSSSKKAMFLTLKNLIISFKIIVEYTSCKYFLTSSSFFSLILKIQGNHQYFKYSLKSSLVFGLSENKAYSSKFKGKISTSMYLQANLVANSPENIVELLPVIKISIPL